VVLLQVHVVLLQTHVILLQLSSRYFGGRVGVGRARRGIDPVRVLAGGVHEPSVIAVFDQESFVFAWDLPFLSRDPRDTLP